MFYVQTEEEERDYYTLVEELLDAENTGESEFMKLKNMNKRILTEFDAMSKYYGKMHRNAEKAYRSLAEFCNTIYGIEDMDEFEIGFSLKDVREVIVDWRYWMGFSRLKRA